MLWHKSWLETRWRFVIGAVLMVCTAVAVVVVYPQIKQLVPAVSATGEGNLAQQVREFAQLARDYRGYVWSQWFAKQAIYLWTLFAVLLGTGGLVSATRSGVLFTLSLPVSRRRLFAVRAATGLAELAVLAVVPALVVAAAAPAIAERYPIGDAVVHAACLFVAGVAFFGLASLLSTLFGDVWRPLLIALFVAIALGLVEQVAPEVSRFSVFSVMSAERYFRGEGLPWLGLVASAAVSVALLYGAHRNIARRDF